MLYKKEEKYSITGRDKGKCIMLALGILSHEGYALSKFGRRRPYETEAMADTRLHTNISSELICRHKKNRHELKLTHI